MCKALACCPFCKIRVITLAGRDEWCKQSDAFALVVAQDSRHDLICALGLDTDAAVWAHLCAEFHVHQPQKVMDFGHGGDSGLAAPAAGALFDRDRGGYAKDCVDIRFACWLHDGARVGV